MVTLHEVITFLVSMQISIAACRPIMSIDVVEVVIWRESSVSGGRSEERFSRNAETDLVCRLLLEKKKKYSVKQLDYIEELQTTEETAGPVTRSRVRHTAVLSS